MAFEAVLAFWVLILAVMVVPGPDWAYMIAAGPQDRVVPAIAGLTLGYVGLTLVLACGLGVLIAAGPWLIAVITVLGAGYLIWMGIGILRAPPMALSAGQEDAKSAKSWFVKAVGTSAFNPKSLLLLVAIMPPFIRTGAAWPVPAQIGLLGAVWTVTCAATYVVVGYGSRAILRSRPQATRWVSRFSGVIIIVVSLGLIGEQALLLTARG